MLHTLHLDFAAASADRHLPERAPKPSRERPLSRLARRGGRA